MRSKSPSQYFATPSQIFGKPPSSASEPCPFSPPPPTAHSSACSSPRAPSARVHRATPFVHAPCPFIDGKYSFSAPYLPPIRQTPPAIHPSFPPAHTPCTQSAPYSQRPSVPIRVFRAVAQRVQNMKKRTDFFASFTINAYLCTEIERTCERGNASRRKMNG